MTADADSPAAPRVAVVGAGAWGTTLAALVARTEPALLLCRSNEVASEIRATRRNERRLPGIDLPDGLIASADPADLAEAVDLVIFAVPSSHLRATAAEVAPHVPASADLLSVVKGLERGTLQRMSEVLAEAGGFDPGRIAARLARREFRLYVNPDLLGVELCGSLKNVLAIAAGAVDELGFGDNGKAGLMTRGLAEMTRLGIAAGANPLTFAGLAGIGDVIATCGSKLSRNHRLGVELAKGRSWGELESALPGTAEGAYTVDAALALADRLGVELPIAREVHNALFEGKSVQRCLIDLLARESKDELADLQAWVDRLAPPDAAPPA